MEKDRLGALINLERKVYGETKHAVVLSLKIS